MPWNNGNDGQGGGSGGNDRPSPWGTPGGGNQGPRQRPEEPRREDRRDERPWGGNGNRGRGPGGGPPDIDEMIGRVQEFVRGLLPPGTGGPKSPQGGAGKPGRFSGGRGLALVVLILAALWLASGFYRVQPDEQGVVLRFGAYERTTLPGLNYHLPWPIERAITLAVTRINRTEIGYRSVGTADIRQAAGRDARDVLEESLMLTGDENIIDIDFAVFWRIRDASNYLFNTRNPAYTVKSASESVMREVIGHTPIQPALTDARAQIEAAVKSGVQAILDQYHAGVEITQVQLQKVDPPAEVIDSFRDVQRANTDAERMRNEAEAYRNDILPRARGEAARLTAEAEAARQAAVVESTGQAQRFLSVLKAYEAAKDVTLKRLYLETMQEILSKTPTVVVDDQLKGVVPFLPLNELGRAPPPAAPAPPPTPAPPRGATR